MYNFCLGFYINIYLFYKWCHVRYILLFDWLLQSCHFFWLLIFVGNIWFWEWMFEKISLMTFNRQFLNLFILNLCIYTIVFEVHFIVNLLKTMFQSQYLKCIFIQVYLILITNSNNYFTTSSNNNIFTYGSLNIY